jgi:hypothetical protein
MERRAGHWTARPRAAAWAPDQRAWLHQATPCPPNLGMAPSRLTGAPPTMRAIGSRRLPSATGGVQLERGLNCPIHAAASPRQVLQQGPTLEDTAGRAINAPDTGQAVGSTPRHSSRRPPATPPIPPLTQHPAKRPLLTAATLAVQPDRKTPPTPRRLWRSWWQRHASP